MAHPTNQEEQDFADGFNEDEQPTQEGDSGLIPNEVEAQAAPTEAVEAQPEAETAQPEPVEDGPAQGTANAAPRELTPEEQRLKSWEGRLKARDAQGVSVEHEEEKTEGPAHELAEPETEEKGEAMAAQLKDMDPDEALAALASDFGDDFTSMLATIIDSKVAKATGKTAQSVEDLVADIKDTKERAHFTMIAGKHPDFMQVAQSQEFEAAIAALPEEKQAEVRKVIQQGSATEIIDLLDGYKESVAQASKPQEPGPDIDAAEGVRSGPARIPTQPTASDDYSAAWDEA